MRQSASILALRNLFVCTNIFPVKVRFNFKTDAGEGWEIPANLMETKILLFPSRILDLVICEIVPFHIWVGIKRKSKKNTIIYKNYSNYFYRKILVFHIFKLLVSKACEYSTLQTRLWNSYFAFGIKFLLYCFIYNEIHMYKYRMVVLSEIFPC